MSWVVKEMLDRLGTTPVVNTFYNYFCEFDEINKLQPNEKPTQIEMCDRVLKHFLGEERGWEYFKEHGFVRWPKKVEEAYWRYFIDARHAIYLEYLVEIGEKIKEITEEIGLKVNMEQYTPLISWFPCSIHHVDDSSFDLYCLS